MVGNDVKNPSYEYTTFPRQFVSYKWYKPLLVALLTVVFITVMQVILVLVASVWSDDPNFIYTIDMGYEDTSTYDGPGALIGLGGIAVFVPALALAALIVRDRPYSSYTSSRGGWNWGAFAKCLGVAVAVFAVSTIVSIPFSSDDQASGQVLFTVSGLIACIVLVPIQCLAEEYVFRGLIMQAVGSWTRLPILAIVVQAVVFAAGHPYNAIGVVSIFLSGIVMGVVAWQTRGLEATSGLHIVNNMVTFLASGFGLQATTSEIDIVSAVFAVVTDVAFAVIVILLARKTNCFSSKGDGAAAFNEKQRAKMAAKQPVVQQQYAVQQYAGQPYPGQPVQQQPYPGQPIQPSYPGQQQYVGQPYPGQQQYVQQQAHPGQQQYAQQVQQQPYPEQSNYQHASARQQPARSSGQAYWQGQGEGQSVEEGWPEPPMRR